MKQYVAKLFNALEKNTDLREAFYNTLDSMPARFPLYDFLMELHKPMKNDHRYLEIIDLAIEKEPEYFDLYSLKASELSKENPRAAIETLSRGLYVLYNKDDEDKDITWCYLRIAELLGKLGEHKESIHACTLALDTKFDPELIDFFYRVSYNLRAEQYLKTGQKNNARKDLKKVLQYSKDDIDIINKIREIDGYEPISDPTKKQNDFSNADSSKAGQSKS